MSHVVLVHHARERLSKNLLFCSAQSPHRDTKCSKCNLPRAAPQQPLTRHRCRLLGKEALLPHSSTSADGVTQSAQGADLDENLTKLFPDLLSCRNASGAQHRGQKCAPTGNPSAEDHKCVSLGWLWKCNHTTTTSIWRTSLKKIHGTFKLAHDLYSNFQLYFQATLPIFLLLPCLLSHRHAVALAVTFFRARKKLCYGHYLL